MNELGSSRAANHLHIILGRDRRDVWEGLHKLLVEQLRGDDADEGHVIRFAEGLTPLQFLEEKTDGTGVKDSAAFQRPGRKNFAQIIRRLAVVKALVDRGAVGTLAALRDGFRQEAFGHLPQKKFLREPIDFPLRWNAVRELEEPDIQERKTSLNGLRHAHSVPLRGEQVL